MKFLLLGQFRETTRRWLVSVSVIVSIALAVSSVIVIHVVSDQVVQNVESTAFRSEYQHVVLIPDRDEESYFQIRRAWREGTFTGIAGMIPVIEGSVSAKGRLVPVVGLDFLADPKLSMVQTATNSYFQALITSNSVLVFGFDWKSGDRILGAKVVGTIDSPRELIVADLPTAQEILDRKGEIDAVWLRNETQHLGSWVEKVWPGLTAGISNQSKPLQITGFDVQDMSNWNPTKNFAGSIAFNLSLLGALALLVSGFLAYEACSSSINRRRLEIDRLHTLGVKRWEIKATLFAEALTLGGMGSVLGICLGWLTLSLLSQLDQDQVSNTILIASIKGLVVGVAATVGAALVAQLREANRKHLAVRCTITVLAIAALGYGLVPNSGLVGAFLVIVAFCAFQLVLIVPAIVEALYSVLRRVQFSRIATTMNLRTLLNQLRSLKLPLTTFSLAIGTAIGIGLLVDSFRLNFQDLLDQRLNPGLYLSNASTVRPEEILDQKGVIEVREYYRARGNLPLGPVSITAAILDTWETSRYGYDGEVSQGVLINEQASKKHNLSIGDPLELTISGKTLPALHVVHIFNSYGDIDALVRLPISAIETDRFIRDRMTVRVREDSSESLQQYLHHAYPEVNVTNQSQIRAQALEIFERSFALTRVIGVIAVVVAVMGLFTALTALYGARKQEFRLLSTLGFSNSTLTGHALSQSMLVSLVACVLALPLGIGIAWSLCNLVNPRAFLWTIDLNLSLESILFPLGLALLATILACFLPFVTARRSLLSSR